MTFIQSLLAACLAILFCISPAQADLDRYSLEITAPKPLDELLKNYLPISKWRDHPRMSSAEWLRLYRATPHAIEELLATEGYFSPTIQSSIEMRAGQTNVGVSHAHFIVASGLPAMVSRVDLKFTGEIASLAAGEDPVITKLRQSWLLQPGMQYRQEDWSQAKRKLLTGLLIARFPDAVVKSSQAEVDPETKRVALSVEVDSGPIFKFGHTSIEGLQRYPLSMIDHLNPIQLGELYSQSKLQIFQLRLMESGYFRSAEVTADTTLANHEATPIKVVVQENQSVKVGVGVGFSTNTGARAQLSYDDLNVLNRGWRLNSSFKVEQKEQSLNGLIRLPTNSDLYRDSFYGNMMRSEIEGQTLSTVRTGVSRSWGSRKREQIVGVNYLVEQQRLEGGTPDKSQAATLSYGITLRRTDNDYNPSRGYMLNAQFALAPLESLSDGRFLQSYAKLRAYYPVSSQTQLIARAEAGMVNGRNSAPAAFLFRAGGDQSVRGYAYQSLGVKEADAIVGGRYLVSGSVEIVQWLTQWWGVAAFVDFGNAGNSVKELKPVYGYGLGARWKSPVGPLGVDVAYGEATGETRLHFNLGVAF